MPNKISIGATPPVMFCWNEILLLDAGTILQMTDSQSIIMKTNSKDEPFVDLTNGDLWEPEQSKEPQFIIITQPITINSK